MIVPGQRTDPGSLVDDSPSVLHMVHQVILDLEAYEAGLPHVVLCVDTDTGLTTVSGPFHDRGAALAVVAHEREADGPDSTLSFTAEALYPPLALATDSADPVLELAHLRSV